jgi:peptide/nickel transport system substrate-binding protein
MSRRGAVPSMLVLGLLLVVSCAPSANAPASGVARPAGAEPAPPAKTLVMISPGELPSFADKQILPAGAAVTTRMRGKEIVNAKLAFRDEQGLPFPVLAEALPILNTDTWRVFPDGRMETSYPLRPNLTWHDGQPMTAEDWVFAWRVYATPEFGVARTGGFRLLEEVTAPDPRTVVLRWRQPYPLAVEEVDVLPPLPRHILEQPFSQLDPDPFMSLAFWRDEYVGAGPFKLERREPGAFFEASAFAGFVFGRPKLDRVRVIYIPDTNTGIATLLSGEAHFYMESSLFGEDGIVIERQWGSGQGTVLYEPISPRAMGIQQRPEVAVPPELGTDARVRRAVAYAMDREELLEVITASKGLLRDVYTHPHADYYETVLRAVPVRYRYDARRAQQLLEEAGFARGADGGWVTPRGERFTLEQWYIGGASNERESNILVAGWRRFGIEATSHLWGVQRTSAEERAKTSGIFGGSHNVEDFHTRDIARPETRWTGSNRYGFTNREYDRLVEAWETTLDRSEHIQHLAQMERIVMEELPAIPLYYNPRVIAYVAGLKNVRPKLVEEAGIERKLWEWEWQA